MIILSRFAESAIFKDGITFKQIIILLIIGIIGTVVIRFTFSLDLNKLLDRRGEKNLSQLKNACPHVELIPHEGNRLESKSLFISPPGTIQWQCQRCGIVKYFQGGELESMQEYYVNHINEYNKKMMVFKKLLKKGKHI